jgi:hypothetical protein
MYKVIFGLAVVAASGAALAQESAWRYYEPEGGTMQAGVVAADGSQFILKCDKPGRQKVYGVVVSSSNLARALPDNNFESYPVSVRFDANPPDDDNWRFNDRFAIAINQGNVRSLTRLLEKMDGASKMEIRLSPVGRLPKTINFDVAGARAAIEMVYASCKDTIPYG